MANKKQFSVSDKLSLCWLNIAVGHEIFSAARGRTSQNDWNESAAEREATQAAARQHHSSEALSQSDSVEQEPRDKCKRVNKEGNPTPKLEN